MVDAESGNLWFIFNFWAEAMIHTYSNGSPRFFTPGLQKRQEESGSVRSKELSDCSLNVVIKRDTSVLK